MNNEQTAHNDTDETLVEIRYVGLGGIDKAKRGTLMLFCPASLYEDLMRDKEHSGVPLLPVPIPPFSEGLYTRRLSMVSGGEDPDGDIFEGYTRVAGVRIKRITLRSSTQGVYGRMTVVMYSGESEAEVPINFEYTIIEAVLAHIPIFMEQSLFDYILSQIKVDARFPGSEDVESLEEHTEEVEDLDDYIVRQIEAQTDPLTEDPEIRKQLFDLSEETLMDFLDLSLEKEAYDWTDFLKLIISTKKRAEEE